MSVYSETVNVIMKSRVRESRTHGSVRGWHREVPVYSTVVNLKKQISTHSLITSTSLALGEAYMDGELEIEGDLYHALNCFLGQIFQNESAYGPILFPPVNAVDKSG